MQLQAYRANLPPYDAPLMQPFQARQWWQAIDSKLPIVHLAAFLLDVVPHAAATERVFSLMGWYHSKQRNRMSVQTTGRLTAIKTFHQQTASRCACQLSGQSASWQWWLRLQGYASMHCS